MQVPAVQIKVSQKLQIPRPVMKITDDYDHWMVYFSTKYKPKNNLSMYQKFSIL
jgi:hypothetical protein